LVTAYRQLKAEVLVAIETWSSDSTSLTGRDRLDREPQLQQRGKSLAGRRLDVAVDDQSPGADPAALS